MNGRVLESRRWEEREDNVLELLAASDTPALATDRAGHVVFWNRAAERLFGRPAGQALGRRCYDLLAGRDAFGNRFCHENCSVVSMSCKGEAIQSFEIVVASPKPEQALTVTILRVPGERPEAFTLVHVLQPIDREGRLVRALERLGAARTPAGGNGWEAAVAQAPSPVALAQTPPLTEREKEILRWVSAGLQNKEIAQKLGISLATVRNHIHNILEKLDVHSKLEAVSLAFRRGWVHGEPGSSRQGGQG
jgi:DNA-binding CsgD family transcriptional regulator